MTIFDAGRSLLKEYHKLGFEAYMVGGCVRDYLLNLPVTDIDICTNARPEESLAHFEKAIPTGIKYGTVTIIWDGFPFEVTTFRKEGEYLDGRRPNQVSYVDSLLEDLLRRDFTINAIAMTVDGEIIDPLHGTVDLQNGIIRTVGDAAKRFQEDGLRLLRAIRFASQLGFKIEDETWNKLHQYKTCIQPVALERIIREMDKILLARYREIGLRYLHQTGLLFRLIEESSVSRFHLSDDLDVIWAALFLFSVPNNQIPFTVHELPFSKKRKKRMQQLLSFHSEKGWMPEQDLLLATYDVPIDLILQYAEFQSLIRGKDFTNHDRDKLFEKWGNLTVKSSALLDIKGNEIAQFLRIKEGKWLKSVLYTLWYQVNFCGLRNEKKALIDYLREIDISGRIEREDPASTEKHP